MLKEAESGSADHVGRVQTIPPEKMELSLTSSEEDRRVPPRSRHQREDEWRDDEWDIAWRWLQVGPLVIGGVKLGKNLRRLIFSSVLAVGGVLLLAKIITALEVTLPILPRIGG